MFDQPRRGTVVRLKKWEHVYENGNRITWHTKSRKEVAVFVMLGHEAIDGTPPLDLEAVMGDMGWVRKKEPKVKK